MNDFGFPALENFKRNVRMKGAYGFNEYECDQMIRETCRFFGIPLPSIFANTTGMRGSGTMFVDRNRLTYLEDIICYDLNELKCLGVNDKMAFALVMTHECAHRVLQNTPLQSWDEELIADYFIGLRAGLQSFPPVSVNKVINGLSSTTGGTTHPSGYLRGHMISYGYNVGAQDRAHGYIRSLQEYLNIAGSWLNTNRNVIYSEQRKFWPA